MTLPQFGQPNQNLYADPNVGSKKKVFLMFGGVLLLLVALFFVLTSGGSSAGQQELKDSLQASSDVLGIIDEYENDLDIAQTKNDISLTQVIIRGNFQKLNTLYNKTYNPKKKFGNSPKPDKKSKETLDSARRNNTLDAEIIEVLKPKIAIAKKELSKASGSIEGKQASADIKKSIEDFSSIEGILNKPR